MSKHTEGPWTYRHEPGGVLTGPDAELAEAQGCEAFALSQIFIEDTGYHITFDPRVPGVEGRALADARLIAAALDLLEALEFGEEIISGDLTGASWKAACNAFASDARAAIAKAKGEDND